MANLRYVYFAGLNEIQGGPVNVFKAVLNRTTCTKSTMVVFLFNDYAGVYINIMKRERILKKGEK